MRYFGLLLLIVVAAFWSPLPELSDEENAW